MLRRHIKPEPIARVFRKLAVGEDGQSVTEYALILTLVAVVVAGVLTLLGEGARVLYERVTPALD